MKRFFSLFLFLLIVITGILINGSINYFYSLSSLLIIFLGTLIITISKHGYSFYKDLNEDTLSTIGTSGLYTGCVGFLIGVILMLTNLSDLSVLANTFLSALVTFFYGTLVFIASFIYSKKMNSMNKVNLVNLFPFIVLFGTVANFVLILFIYSK